MRRTKIKLEEELCVAQEKERQEGGLLDKLCMQPQVVLRRLDGSQEYFGPEQQEPEFLDIKLEESEPHDVKKEEQLLPCMKEEEDFTELQVTGIRVKSEDEGQYEENKGAEHPSNISSEHMSTEIDGKHGGGLQADSWLAPMSDSDDTTAHSPHDGEQSEGALTCHTDSKHWKCSQCGKTLHSKFNLKRHMMCHTGEKPFACLVCGQTFSQAASLRPHIRIHNGEKPFACSVCGQRFTRKEHLKEHTKIHSGEKPFACLVCGQKFSQNRSLKHHTRTHTGEKPFACSVCGQRFSQRRSLTRHIKNVIRRQSQPDTEKHTRMRNLLHLRFVGKDFLKGET